MNFSVILWKTYGYHTDVDSVAADRSNPYLRCTPCTSAARNLLFLWVVIVVVLHSDNIQLQRFFHFTGVKYSRGGQKLRDTVTKLRIISDYQLQGGNPKIPFS